MDPIGFVGLGTIGGAIARSIQQAGHPMVVHDILPESGRSLTAAPNREHRQQKSPGVAG